MQELKFAIQYMNHKQVSSGKSLYPLNNVADLDQDVIKNCKTGSFANDTKLKSKIDIAEDTLDVQEDLKNNMSLHEDKFIYLRYCTNKSTLLNELPFTAEYAEYDKTSGYALNPSKSARDLGIQMSADYAWSHHIGDMVRGARNAASWVLRVFKNRSCYSFTNLS